MEAIGYNRDDDVKSHSIGQPVYSLPASGEVCWVRYTQYKV